MTLLACRRSKERFSFLFFITDILPAASMAGMTSLIPEEVLFQVLREIGLIPQLYEEFLVSDEKIIICLPSRKYSRSVSVHFLAFTTEFYCGLLRQSGPVRICSLCSKHHGQNYLCLPGFVQSLSVDLLFDILESKRGYLSFADDLVAVVRLRGYLLIKTNVIHAFLVNLLSLDEV